MVSLLGGLVSKCFDRFHFSPCEKVEILRMVTVTSAKLALAFLAHNMYRGTLREMGWKPYDDDTCIIEYLIITTLFITVFTSAKIHDSMMMQKRSRPECPEDFKKKMAIYRIAERRHNIMKEVAQLKSEIKYTHEIQSTSNRLKTLAKFDDVLKNKQSQLWKEIGIIPLAPAANYLWI